VWSFVVAACGRIAFDPLGDANRYGSSDGSMLSCQGLASTCGPTGTSPCCGSPLVPGGTFYRSFDVGTDNMYTDMTNPATVSDFRLDTYEVTVGRFRQFVNAGMGTQANPPAIGVGARTLNGMANQGGWDPSWTSSLAADTGALVAAVNCDATYQSWTDAPGANEALPMNCITWSEAMAFCMWDGGFLPTEAEWNYAAAGGSEQRAYPWSSPPDSLAIDCSYANYVGPPGACVNTPSGAVNRVGSESPTGDAKYGQADLAGNVYEWALDSYQTPYSNPCTDCADLTPNTERVIRGGYFFNLASVVRGGFRDYGAAPNARTRSTGARCARTP
jgi:formylglycine-generating enzyme required for sulfatase activity